MDRAIEVNMDTLVAYVGGVEIDGRVVEEDHYVFDNISPRQAFILGRKLGFAHGFQEGIAANDEY